MPLFFPCIRSLVAHGMVSLVAWTVLPKSLAIMKEFSASVVWRISDGVLWSLSLILISTCCNSLGGVFLGSLWRVHVAFHGVAPDEHFDDIVFS